jgi:hypothetical protein
MYHERDVPFAKETINSVAALLVAALLVVKRALLAVVAAVLLVAIAIVANSGPVATTSAPYWIWRRVCLQVACEGACADDVVGVCRWWCWVLCQSYLSR